MRNKNKIRNEIRKRENIKERKKERKKEKKKEKLRNQKIKETKKIKEKEAEEIVMVPTNMIMYYFSSIYAKSTWHLVGGTSTQSGDISLQRGRSTSHCFVQRLFSGLSGIRAQDGQCSMADLRPKGLRLQVGDLRHWHFCHPCIALDLAVQFKLLSGIRARTQIWVPV